MFINGRVVTGGEKCRLHRGLFGVLRYEPGRCFNGFTLFSPAWGDTEYLIDMRGLVVHRWRVTHSNVAEILPNGNLFTHNCGSWLEELTPDSEVVWRWEGEDWMDPVTHHDFYWAGDDGVVLLSRKQESVIAGVYPTGHEPDCMKTDLVLRINREGRIVWQFSFGDHVEELCALAGLPMPIPYARERSPGEFVPYGPADWAHANTVEVLPDTPLGRRDERFRAGNLLFSLRQLDIIGVIDPAKDALVWCYGPGVLDGQHQPTMLDDGHILVFDNGTYRGRSIVRELQPDTGRIVWQYEDGERFFSPFRSGNQRLANGNTLICECDAGHLFEVTGDGEIVWDFYSPFVGQGAQHLGKRIHRATRYTAEQVQPVFDARSDQIVAEVTPHGRRVETLADVVRLYQSDYPPASDT